MLLDFAQRRAFRIQKWLETTFLVDSGWIIKTYWKRIAFFAVLGLAGAEAPMRGHAVAPGPPSDVTPAFPTR